MPPLHRENTLEFDHPISRHSTTPAIPFQALDDDHPGALGKPCRLTGPILHQNITTTTAATPQRRAPRQKPAAPDNPVAGCISRQPPTFHVARYILTHGYHHARQGAVGRPALGDDGRYLSAISALLVVVPHNRCLPPAGGDRPVVRHVPGNLFAVHALSRGRTVEGCRTADGAPACARLCNLCAAARR